MWLAYNLVEVRAFKLVGGDEVEVELVVRLLLEMVPLDLLLGVAAWHEIFIELLMWLWLSASLSLKLVLMF